MRKSGSDILRMDQLQWGCSTGEKMKQNVTANWTDLGINGNQTVRDLWRQKDLGRFKDKFTASVARHGVVMVKMHQAARIIGLINQLFD